MTQPRLVIAGCPGAPIGRGEDARCIARSLAAAHYPAAMLDIYRLVDEVPFDQDLAPELIEEFGDRLVDRFGHRLNLFLINGDEVPLTLDKLPPGTIPSEAYNIVYPQWELSKYPEVWARGLDRFDEIWAPSQFVLEALRPVVTKPIHYVPLATEPRLTRPLGRRHFGIPESPFAFLFFFDFRSYSSRKNPAGALEAFKRVHEARPSADICMVIKVNRPLDHLGRNMQPEFRDLVEALNHAPENVVLIDRLFDDNETKNLVRCCDAFVSLHRSEGYGRGLAEAMSFGRPVVGTAYSGNVDFMNEANSCLVPFTLKPVLPGEYPQHEGQVWAEPDVEVAANCMLRLFDEPAYADSLGREASRTMRTHFSYRAVGLKLRARLEAAEANLAGRTS